MDILGRRVKNPPAMQESQEPQVGSLGWEDLLEEGMAVHSSILAWTIPRTKEPGGLQSTGSQRHMTEVTEHANIKNLRRQTKSLNLLYRMKCPAKNLDLMIETVFCTK